MRKKSLFFGIILVLMLNFMTVPASAALTFGDYEYELDGWNAVITKYIGTAEHVEIPAELDGIAVSEIGETAFAECTSVTSIVIPYGISTIAQRAFRGCANLESITIPDSVTSIGEWAFNHCPKLLSITLPDSVTDIGEAAFYLCTGMTSVTLPKGITDIKDHTFSACESLVSIDIPDGVTSIGPRAFGYCLNLTSVTLPDSVQTIGEDAFYLCNKLTLVTIPKGVTSLDYGTFYTCATLKNVVFMNPETIIKEVGYTEPEKTVNGYAIGPIEHYPTFNEKLLSVYGFEGSTAHTFALNGGKTFIPIANVTLDGRLLSFDVPPQLIDARTMVPMRKIFEELDAKVTWAENTQTITAVKGDIEIIMQVGNNEITVNGKTIELDVAPQLVNSRTLVPVRAVSESLNADVQWDDQSKTVVITTSEQTK